MTGYELIKQVREKTDLVKLTLGDPVLVAQAPPELNRAAGAWGRWQFPYLRRLSDGRLHISFSVEPDAASSYGKPMAHAYSGDEGRTWRVGSPQIGHEAEDGIVLPNGDRLQAVERPARRAEEFDLPDSVCDYVCDFKLPRSLYRAEELPAELNEWRFRRLPAGESEWVEEVAEMRIPNQLRSAIHESARGATPGIGGIAQVRQGPMPTPFLWGKMRVAADDSLWTVTFVLRLQAGKPLYIPLFLRSLDQGHSWNCLGEIPYAGDAKSDPLAEKRTGFTEPDYNFRPDGSVICVMRTSDGNGLGPLYLTRSEDGARTWSKPVLFDRSFDGGKMPQLLTLDNGVTLAAYGQSGGPGYFAVRATTDPAGLEWDAPVYTKVSRGEAGAWDTCGHTEMVALNEACALIVYSDFNYPDVQKRKRKSILVRVIETNIRRQNVRSEPMAPHTYYIDPVNGDNASDGISPERPLKSHAEREVLPGDTVLFKRGSVIRDMMHTCNGEEGAPLTYGAYGEGDKPTFLGSVAVGDPGAWTEERPNVWRYTGTLSSEVCNLVFNDGEFCGTLRWSFEDLRHSGEWYYTTVGATSAGDCWEGPDSQNAVLYLCSPTNPGQAYGSIECVLWGQRKLAGGQCHVVLENLSFRNSGVHGYHACHVRNVTIRDCDFRHIGGAVWHRQRRIRFGNAIELWDGASDVTVERCCFDTIYDSGVTHQGGETRNIPQRLYFRNNRFTDCGMSAYECREPSQEVYFESNTCVVTGGGFGLQGEAPPRQSEIYPQPIGHHVFIWRIEPGTQPGHVYIRDNLFSETPCGAAIYSVIEPADEHWFVLDRNTYGGRPDGLVARWGGRTYSIGDFKRYQAETGLEPNGNARKETRIYRQSN